VSGYGHHGWPRPTDWWHGLRRGKGWGLLLVLALGGVTVAVVLLDLIRGR